MPPGASGGWSRTTPGWHGLEPSRSPGFAPARAGRRPEISRYLANPLGPRPKPPRTQGIRAQGREDKVNFPFPPGTGIVREPVFTIRSHSVLAAIRRNSSTPRNPGCLRQSKRGGGPAASCLLSGDHLQLKRFRPTRSGPRTGPSTNSAKSNRVSAHESATARWTGGGGTILFDAPGRQQPEANRMPSTDAERLQPPLPQLAQRDQDEPVPLPARDARSDP